MRVLVACTPWARMHEEQIKLEMDCPSSRFVKEPVSPALTFNMHEPPVATKIAGFFSHNSLRKVSRKPKILNRMWCYWLVFIFRSGKQLVLPKLQSA